MKTKAGIKLKKLWATEILEVELWDLTLKKLENSDDIYAAYNACNTFSKLLTQRRSTFLFSMAVPILMDKVVAIGEEVGSPFYLPFVDGLLPLRLVCKRWKSAVDQYLQYMNYLDYTSNQTREPSQFNPFKFETVETVERFIEKTKTHTSHENPFFTTKVTFDDNNFMIEDHELVRFWETVISKVLLKFGKNVIFCELTCLRISQIESLGYLVLGNVLREMPALRFLGLTADFKEQDLPNQVDLAPLPDFQGLHTIHIINSGMTLTTELLRASRKCKLEVLIVEVFDNVEDQLDLLTCKLLSRLQSLKHVTLSRFLSFKSLFMLCNVRWSVTYLNLAVRLVDDDSLPLLELNTDPGVINFPQDQISLPRLFQALSSQGQSSTIRHLSLHLIGSTKFGPNCRLRLPHLEYLDITCQYEQIAVNSLDFVAEMKVLKSLFVAVNRPFPTDKNNKEVVKFAGYVTDMKKSNIWTVLSKLEHLNLTIRDRSGNITDLVYNR